MQVCAAVTFPINTDQHLTSYCYFFPEKDPPYPNAPQLPQLAVGTPFNTIFLSFSMDVKNRMFFWALSPLSHLSSFHPFILQRYEVF